MFVGVLVGVTKGVPVGVFVGVTDAVPVGVFVGVTDAVPVGVFVGVTDAVPVGVGVCEFDTVGVTVLRGVSVGNITVFSPRLGLQHVSLSANESVTLINNFSLKGNLISP